MYTPPKKIREWVNDIPGGELYAVYVSDDKKVWATSGRYAHSSGARSASWNEFLSGQLHEVVTKTMGEDVLNEVVSYVKARNT